MNIPAGIARTLNSGAKEILNDLITASETGTIDCYPFMWYRRTYPKAWLDRLEQVDTEIIVGLGPWTVKKMNVYRIDGTLFGIVWEEGATENQYDIPADPKIVPVEAYWTWKALSGS